MFRFLNLDQRVREWMVSEIGADVAAGSIYISPRLTSRGETRFPELLVQAAMLYDVPWLIRNIRPLIRTEEQRQGRNIKMASNAADMLAEGEFNKYYCRAVCLRAMELDPIATVQVYRAKQVSEPRLESEARIGTTIPASELLADLRANTGLTSLLRVPGGPNSGLSVKLISQ